MEEEWHRWSNGSRPSTTELFLADYARVELDVPARGKERSIRS